MSALSTEQQNDLVSLLHGLNSADNSIRSQAEDRLVTDWQASRPDVLLMGLVEQVHAAPDEKVGPVSMSGQRARLTDRQ